MRHVGWEDRGEIDRVLRDDKLSRGGLPCNLEKAKDSFIECSWLGAVTRFETSTYWILHHVDGCSQTQKILVVAACKSPT